MVSANTATQRIKPFVITEDREVVVAKRRNVMLRNLHNAAPLFVVGQADAKSNTLTNSVITG